MRKRSYGAVWRKRICLHTEVLCLGGMRGQGRGLGMCNISSLNHSVLSSPLTSAKIRYLIADYLDHLETIFCYFSRLKSAEKRDADFVCSRLSLRHLVMLRRDKGIKSC